MKGTGGGPGVDDNRASVNTCDTGTAISYLPVDRARAAFSCDATAIKSCFSRETPNCSATFSDVIPFGDHTKQMTQRHV